MEVKVTERVVRVPQNEQSDSCESIVPFSDALLTLLL